jgi:hypothetical protein
MTDFRALCAELLPLSHSSLCAEEMVDSAIESIQRARAALAQSEPEGVGDLTDEDLLRTYGLAKRDHCYEGPTDDWPKRSERSATVCGLRAVIAADRARWGLNDEVQRALVLAVSTLEGWNNHGDWVWPESALAQAKQGPTETLGILRDLLARYTRPTTEPVPVSERLPGPEDCDAEGRC